MLDLDRFKQVNDQFGHHAGDDLLKAVAVALQGRVRDTASWRGWVATSSGNYPLGGRRAGEERLRLGSWKRCVTT